MNNEQIDEIAKKYVGLGGVEDYRSFARDILAASAGEAGTIDTPEFREALAAVIRGDLRYGLSGPAYKAFIAHINQHVVAAVAEENRRLSKKFDEAVAVLRELLMARDKEISDLRAATAPVSAAPTYFDTAIASGALKWDHNASARAIAYEGFKAGRASLRPSAGAPATDLRQLLINATDRLPYDYSVSVTAEYGLAYVSWTVPDGSIHVMDTEESDLIENFHDALSAIQAHSSAGAPVSAATNQGENHAPVLPATLRDDAQAEHAIPGGSDHARADEAAAPVSAAEQASTWRGGYSGPAPFDAPIGTAKLDAVKIVPWTRETYIERGYGYLLADVPADGQELPALTDKEYADPEYMRAYIASRQDGFDEAMAEVARLRSLLAMRQPQGENEAMARYFGLICKKCGSNRLEEACKNPSDCGMTAVALVAAKQAGKE